MKANRGAAGTDEETIAMFEQDLSRHLYKLWNHASSGSYFPPPVKQVEIVGAYARRRSEIANDSLDVRQDGPRQVFKCRSNPHFVSCVIHERTQTQ